MKITIREHVLMLIIGVILQIPVYMTEEPALKVLFFGNALLILGFALGCEIEE